MSLQYLLWIPDTVLYTLLLTTVSCSRLLHLVNRWPMYQLLLPPGFSWLIWLCMTSPTVCSLRFPWRSIQLKAYSHISTISQKGPVSWSARNRCKLMFENFKYSLTRRVFIVETYIRKDPHNTCRSKFKGPRFISTGEQISTRFFVREKVTASRVCSFRTTTNISLIILQRVHKHIQKSNCCESTVL